MMESDLLSSATESIGILDLVASSKDIILLYEVFLRSAYIQSQPCIERTANYPCVSAFSVFCLLYSAVTSAFRSLVYFKSEKNCQNRRWN